MLIPTIAQARLNVQQIDWTGLDHRFMNQDELEVVVALVRSVAPSTVIEIGVNTGRTALALLNHVPTIKSYIGIDVFENYIPSKPVQRYEVPKKPGFLAAKDKRFDLLLSGRGSLDLEPVDLPPCEAIFIDGDHGREAVKHDTELAYALIKPGGIIIWHDYHDLGTVDVREVLDEYYRAGAPLLHVERTWLVFQRWPSRADRVNSAAPAA